VIELLGQDGHEDLRRELDELTAAGDRLGAQLNLLRTHTDRARLEEIAQRLEELDQRATTVDPSQLDRMRAALEAERAALSDALTTVEELELERQSMLHMLSALHLEIIRNGITKASDAELSGRISDLRAKTSAHREVDAALARARQARRLS
jgi:molecular chaperone GrpE (heat shock protein)